MTASVNLSAPLVQKFWDNSGNPAAGCKLFTYAAGTNTKQPVYTDSTGLVPCTDPIILDATGSATFWPDTSLTYKFVLAPANDTDPPTSPIWTRDGVQTPANTASAAAAAAAAAQPYVDAASTSATSAAASAVTAGNYAAAAVTGAKFFTTIALGVAGVSTGLTFGVIAGGSDGLTRPTIYKNVDGTAGNALFLYGVVTGSEYDALFPVIPGVSPVFGVNDDRGNSALEVEPDGSATAANLIPLQLNGLDQRFRLQPASLGNYDAEMVVLFGDGQSNMLGRNPGSTIVQEFDNIGFAYQASSPVSTLPLTVLNCGAPIGNAGGLAQSLIFGALGYIKLLIQQENGLGASDIAFQLLAADNSQGSTAISAHAKGSQYYGYGTSQATSAVTIAAAASKTVIHGGGFWNQGEADAATSLATYQAALQLLATNYNTDLKAITGQTKDITLITAQTTSTAANRNIALAQLAASLASSLVKMSVPMYIFDYEGDGIHVIGLHDYWMGAYYGLAWKRLWVDLAPWKPVRPLSAQTIGNVSYVTFDCMVQPLVLDTTLVPAQTNFGFTLSSGHSITSVSVVRPNVVKIVGASALAGDTLQYGFGAATGKGAYTGAAGNLRDSQGNCVPKVNGHPMHNWCFVSTQAL